MDVGNSKNVVIGGFRNVEGNIHIGDIYYSGDIPFEEIDYYEGLPDIANEILLPQEPYIGLRWFAREEARIFFGRGRLIRQIYKLVTSNLSDRFIFLYGQSGVGKSSVLAAGVMPRIESNYTIHYYRRETDKTVWQSIGHELSSETEMGQQTLLIIDQFEEIYTQPNLSFPNEAVETVTYLIECSRKYLHMKFILGFRKEYLSEIELLFTNQRTNFTKIFIEPLNEQEISEAVYGVCKDEKSNAKYHLKIDKKLPAIIARDLSRDESSQIAPSLQILMTKLWISAKQASPNSPEITKELYNERVTTSGILLSEFLTEQISVILKDNAEWVTSGLVYDLLATFVTEHNTAASWRNQDILELYQHIPSIKLLLTALKDLYLITEDITYNQENKLRLAHDSLAPLVKKVYNNSLFFGQQAKIILENRIKKTSHDNDGPMIYSPLDTTDLNIVLSGNKGMRIWTNQEQQLINISKQKKIKSERSRKFIFGVALLSALIIVILLYVSFNQRKITQLEKDNNKALDMASKARDLFTENPTQAIRLLEEANKLSPNNATILKYLYLVYLTLNEYPAYYKKIETHFHGSDFVLAPNEQFLAEFEGGSSRKKDLTLIIDLSGKIHGRVQYKGYEIRKVAFFKKSLKIAVLFELDEEDEFDNPYSVILVTDFSGKVIDKLPFKNEVTNFTISPDETFILTAEGQLDDDEENNYLIVRSLNNHQEIKQFSLGKEHISEYDDFSWHPDGKHVVFCTFDSIKVLNTTNMSILTRIIHGGQNPIFSPKGNYFAAGSSRLGGKEGGHAIVWDTSGRQIANFSHKDDVESLNFSKDEKLVVTSSWGGGANDDNVKLWKVTGEPIRTINTKRRTWYSYFSKSSDKIISISHDDGITIWNTEGKLLSTLENGLGVKQANFISNNTKIISTTDDGIKFWDTNPFLKEFSDGRWQFYDDTHYFNTVAHYLSITDTNKNEIFSCHFPLNIMSVCSYYNLYWVATGTNHKNDYPQRNLPDTCIIYYYKNNILQSKFTKINYAIRNLQVDSSKQELLAVCTDKKVRLLNYKGDSIRSFYSFVPFNEDELDEICSAQFSPDATEILLTTMTGYKLLYTREGKLLKKITTGIREDRMPTKNGYSGASQSACFSPDGSKLGIFSAESTIYIHKPEDAKVDSIILEREGSIYSVYRNGQFISNDILLAQSGFGVSLFDINTKETIASLNRVGDEYFNIGKRKDYMFVNTDKQSTYLLSLPSHIFEWIKSAPIAPLQASLKSRFSLD